MNINRCGHWCEDCVRQPDRPLNKSIKPDCKFYIPRPPVYGKWVERYGFCTNRKRNEHRREEFSIYNHKVCWMLNIKKIPDWCECVDCGEYVEE